MNVHVSVTGEPNQAYANMIALLLYSLRQNGGALSDVPVTVAVNEAGMSEAHRREIESFGTVTCRIMPRQHGGGNFANKFNALYAPVEDYDVLLYLDCDAIILRPIEDMVAGMDPGKAQFRARTMGEPGAQSAGPVEALIREHALPKGASLEDVADDQFPIGYPLFNCGIMVMTRPAVKHVRQDASRIAHKLYTKRARTTKSSVLEMFKEAGRRARARLFSNPTQGTYDFWVTEQLGVAFSLIRNEIEYEVLPPRYNWVHPHAPPDGDVPALFHYMSGRHPGVDREHLFEGEWIADHLSSDAPTRRALAQLAREYAAERRSHV